MYEWSDETRRVLRAYLRAVAAATPLQQELARRYGIALGDVHALRVVRDIGEVPISRVCGALGIRPSNATNLVDRLEAAGLIERRVDPGDRRLTVVAVTARGQEALGDRALFASSDLVRGVERLTTGERFQLATLLERMLEGAARDPDATREGAGVPDAGPAARARGTGDGLHEPALLSAAPGTMAKLARR